MLTKEEILNELDGLYRDLDKAYHIEDEEDLCREFNVDSRQQLKMLVRDEIDCLEKLLRDYYPETAEDDGMDYRALDRQFPVPFF